MASVQQMTPPATAGLIEIVPVSARIGAEIRGVSLSDDLDEATIDAIQAALVRHKVIFFRGQHDLGDAGHEAFAAKMGEPIRHPTLPAAEGSRYLLELNSTEGRAASNWHTDVTFLPAYPKASILRALHIPEIGGDTLWANCVTAYEELPDPLKLLVENLRALHNNEFDYAEQFAGAGGTGAKKSFDQYRDNFTSTIHECDHPVVRVHPISGERALLAGAFLKGFVGFNKSDSRRLYDLLQEHITKPENTVRWRWQPGDVAMWDNRATQHRAIADFGFAQRTLRRATLQGEVAIGVDGRESQATRGA